jgi:hypothetical protein
LKSGSVSDADEVGLEEDMSGLEDEDEEREEAERDDAGG